MMNGHYTRDGNTTDVRKCRNCGQPKGRHAAITSGINDEHWCPNTSGKGFREDNENIGANIFWPAVKLTEAEEMRQYLLLTTAAAVHARLENPDGIDYAIDRLQRVINQADETGQSEIATIARGELDVAIRLKGENSFL